MAVEEFAKTALITGGEGFIGSRLAKALLEKGLRVRVLDARNGSTRVKKDSNLEFVAIGGDAVTGGMVNKEIVNDAMRDVDVVYHLAINWDGHSWRHNLPLADLFDINIRGTLNLLEAAKSQSVRHFLFSSSCAVYGQSSSPILDEEGVCKPETWNGYPGRAYGIVKLASERLCLLYYQEYGLPVTVFRVDFVFDEANPLPSRTIVENVRKGEPIEVIEGEGYGSVHVDEVVDAFLLATLNKNAYGQVFNLSNPTTYISYQQLYELLIGLTNSRSEIKTIKSPGNMRRARLSSEKIQSQLSWKPRKTKEELEKAIRQSVI